ncbi:carbon catabolite-derepressing protein kinase, putative [Entamoeba invadens IP1]|uniref:Carbon catabolite-derepressing protein kinase, putative n=1 Tax=Entamoeba invadens IP1 TaxID=370355 RepID=L7FMG0_ENTIV|nr:carbon catabolite-derepressing protein kinase, putative [Entamoeba invadens IP1]ELP86336.1 carbon catabolite-derepressing protein kinase, putative [Entamoeba invadens IP1]|eukprot:XP_004185682.1 carbon catabolite-derepressing protein kinase, putative [Entamoeba invadens IP1]
MQDESIDLRREDLEIDTENDFLGEGSFGIVYKARLKGSVVAVKVPKDEISREVLASFRKEMELMKQSHSPNVVLFIGISKDGNNPIFVTEFVKSDLDHFVHDRDTLPIEYLKKKFDLSLKFDLFHQCCVGVQWLHNRLNLIHRDIKPANFLLDENFLVKVCDFGFAESVKESKHEDKGSPIYCAPEVMDYDGTHPYSKEIDIYSLGITMWELFYEGYPFGERPEIDTRERLIYELKRGVRPTLPITFVEKYGKDSSQKAILEYAQNTLGRFSIEIPRTVEDLIATCWDSDGKKRPDINQLTESVQKLKVECALGNATASEWWKKTFEKKGISEDSVLVEDFVKALQKAFKPKDTVIQLLKQNVGISNEVDLQRFEYLTASFGNFYNNKDAFKKMVEAYGSDWWFPFYSKEEAVSQLEGRVDGTFLVRESTSVKGSPFTISKRTRGKTTHVRINTRAVGKGLEYSVALQTSKTVHSDLCTLITALMAMSVISEPCTKESAPSQY